MEKNGMATKGATAMAAVKEIEGAAAVERITNDPLWDELCAVQQAIAEDQRRIAEMQGTLMKRVGVSEYLAERIRLAYDLKPQDSLDSDGAIHRYRAPTAAKE